MKAFHIIFLILALPSFSFSFDGNETHTVSIDKGFFGTTYLLDGKEVPVDEIEALLPYVPEAKDEWATGNTLRYTSWALALAGGFSLGYGIVDSQSPDAMDEATMSGARGVMILGGGAAIVIAFIMEHVGNSKKDHAIEIFNSQNGKNDFSRKEGSSLSMRLTTTEQGGIGLAFNF